MFPVNRKPAGPGGPNAGCPSDHQAREKLALYVYEYLHHIGAKEAAQTFLKEIRWDKNITLGEPPGFLHSWWCVFWDLYCAAPERRETCEHSQEAKAFHDYVGIQGFVNSGFPPQVNGIHGPNATPSPIGMPSSGPDGIPPGAGHPGIPGPSGPPPFFTGPGGVPIRPSPPQVAASSQASPHHSGPSGMMPCISQPGMPPGGPQRFMGPRGGPGPGQRMPVGSEAGMMGFPGGHPGMGFPDQMRSGGMMTLQRLPPSGHPRMQMNPINNFGAMRPPGGVPVSAGLRHPVSWAPSTSSAPIMSNGPGPGPGTPGIMPSPQNMPPSDMNTGDRFGVMPGSVGPIGQSFGPMTSEASMVGGPGGDQMMMNGDGLDIKNSPSSSQGLNGQGTPGPAPPGGVGGPTGGPGSVPPSSGAPGSAESMEFSNSNPFNQGQDLEQQASEIAKIKQSMMEETKRFESKDGVTTGNRPDGDYDF